MPAGPVTVMMVPGVMFRLPSAAPGPVPALPAISVMPRGVTGPVGGKELATLLVSVSSAAPSDKLLRLISRPAHISMLPLVVVMPAPLAPTRKMFTSRPAAQQDVAAGVGGRDHADRRNQRVHVDVLAAANHQAAAGGGYCRVDVHVPGGVQCQRRGGHRRPGERRGYGDIAKTGCGNAGRAGVGRGDGDVGTAAGFQCGPEGGGVYGRGVGALNPG